VENRRCHPPRKYDHPIYQENTMANRKPQREDSPQQLAESSPNPHGEQRKVIEMPLRPDQRQHTKKNVAQSTSTVENRMNPSVATPAEAGTSMDSDSMFNSADPQVTGKDPTTDRPDTEGAGDLRRRNKVRRIS
jgi:hypothetical protein